MVCGVGYGAYSFLKDADTYTESSPSSTQPTGEKSPSNAARRFLAEWGAGNWRGAAALTDDPTPAADALVNFNTGLDIRARTLTAAEPKPELPGGAIPVSFEAKMTVGSAGDWTYTGTLNVAEAKAGAQAGKGYVVTWAPSVLHPELSAQTRFKLVRTQSGPGGPVLHAKDGTALPAAEHPALSGIQDGLLRKSKPGEKGSDSGTITLVQAGNGTPIKEIAKVGDPTAAPPKEGGIETTLDAKLQAAAERAVKGESRTTALAAVRISTGEIVAVVNNPAAGANNAFQGRTPPGSTLKIVTAATLLEMGAVTLDAKVGCPETANAGGRAFTNSEGRAYPDASFKQAFAQSCNTTMAALQSKLNGEDLSRVAHDYFGIGGDWKTGIVSFDGRVPAATGDTMKTADMIGQGEVLMNPLTMASVVATAKSGTFRQPHLTPDTEQLWKASKSLTPAVSGQLRTLMKSVVTEGTARGALAGLSGDVGAKTGTAEVGEGKPNNGWMVAYRGDIAVAVWVEGGITGGQSAGPIVKSFLGSAS
nr:penicillin-binding transpeptidase domain-containing protein [Streptomyces sp. SID3343]